MKSRRKRANTSRKNPITGLKCPRCDLKDGAQPGYINKGLFRKRAFTGHMQQFRCPRCSLIFPRFYTRKPRYKAELLLSIDGGLWFSVKDCTELELEDAETVGLAIAHQGAFYLIPEDREQFFELAKEAMLLEDDAIEPFFDRLQLLSAPAKKRDYEDLADYLKKHSKDVLN